MPTRATQGTSSPPQPAEVDRIFNGIADRLLALYLSFWHRWEFTTEDRRNLRIYSDRGEPTLHIEQAMHGYRVYSLTRDTSQPLVGLHPSLQAALRACGLD